MKFIIPEVIYHEVQVPDDVFRNIVEMHVHEAFLNQDDHPADISWIDNMDECIEYAADQMDPSDFAHLAADPEAARLMKEMVWDDYEDHTIRIDMEREDEK